VCVAFVVCAVIDAFVCAKQCYTYIGIELLVILQEDIGTVTVGRVESMGEEDYNKIKTEEFCIQLVRTVKCEQEVSVLR
jgi:hypothetical protein